MSVFGPDKGKGGKYLIMPPGYGPVEAPGYFVVEATSRDVLAGFRLLGADKDKAIAELVPQIKTYSWTVEGTGEAMPARDAGDKKWSQMPPHGMAYWDSLNEVIQRNPIDERDRLILAQLRFLGIERGQPFKPDQRQAKLLNEGVVVGEAMAKANTTDKRVEPPFWEGTNWKHALIVSTDQRANTYDQLDERAAWFYEAVVISKAMLTQTPGVGQRYIASYKDGDGDWLSGGNTYKLHVPANPPAKGFWSVTAYDEATRQMPITEQGRPDISSRKTDIVKNSDGSVDVYFGPKAPEVQRRRSSTNRGRCPMSNWSKLVTPPRLRDRAAATAGKAGGVPRNRMRSFRPLGCPNDTRRPHLSLRLLSELRMSARGQKAMFCPPSRSDFDRHDASAACAYGP